MCRPAPGDRLQPIRNEESSCAATSRSFMAAIVDRHDADLLGWETDSKQSFRDRQAGRMRHGRQMIRLRCAQKKRPISLGRKRMKATLFASAAGGALLLGSGVCYAQMVS